MALTKGQRNAPSMTGKGAIWSARQRFERMRGLLDLDRQTFMADWRDLGDFILPRKMRQNVYDTNRGGRRNSNIIDSTGTFAARTLASGMMSGVTSPARPWFRLTVSDYELAERADVRAWLDEVTDRMRHVLSKSNLYKVLPICYGDLGVFGTHAMMCVEDEERTIRFYAFPVGSYYLANDGKGQVRVFLREFRLTVRQLVDRFGQRNAAGEVDWSNFSTPIKSLWDNHTRDAWVDVVHVIEPNDQWNPKKLESKFKRFRSVYYERGVNKAQDLQSGDVGESFLEDKGFDEFPVFAPRWEVTGEDVYATTCPGMVCLGDIKQLQHGEKKAAKALDKMVDPPLVGPPGLMKSKTSLLPGDLTLTDESNDKKLRPIHEINIRLDLLENKQQIIRARIQRGFFADLFLMLDYQDAQNGASQKTATEIQERHEEKLLALGPMLENLTQELLDPMVTRVYNIMQRAGQLPPPPQELQGQSFEVEYTSIMAQAQKLVGLGGIERAVSFIGNVAAAKQDPTVWDKFDTDQAIDEYGESAGLPSRLIVPDEKVAAIRKARQDAVNQQQQAALANQASSAALNLSKTDTGSKNALTDLLGNSAGGGQP